MNYKLIDTWNNDRVITPGLSWDIVFSIKFNLTAILLDEYKKNHTEHFGNEFNKIIFRYAMVAILDI